MTLDDYPSLHYANVSCVLRGMALAAYPAMVDSPQNRVIRESRSAHVHGLRRYTWAWVHTRHGAMALARLGLPACLSAAYLHPTSLWVHELPIRIGVLGWLLSVAGACGWLALGWAIYRLSPAAAAAALLIYVVSRGGHVLYAFTGSGTPEGFLHLAVTPTLVLLLLLSVYGTSQYQRLTRVKRC